MSYNIKDFWLRFNGESGSTTDEGAELDEDDLERLEIVAGVINNFPNILKASDHIPIVSDLEKE